jgi:hypothetical protein
MARNHPENYPDFSKFRQQRGKVVSEQNIAQTLACGGLFGFCSENKNLGTGVTRQGGTWQFLAILVPKRFNILRINDWRNNIAHDLGRPFHPSQPIGAFC